jgi:hypothetical protein
MLEPEMGTDVEATLYFFFEEPLALALGRLGLADGAVGAAAPRIGGGRRIAGGGGVGAPMPMPSPGGIPPGAPPPGGGIPIGGIPIPWPLPTFFA